MSLPLLALASLGFSVASEESTDIRTYHVLVEGELGREPGHRFEVVTFEHPFLDVESPEEVLLPTWRSLEKKAIRAAADYPIEFVEVIDRAGGIDPSQLHEHEPYLDVRVGGIVQGGYLALVEVMYDLRGRLWGNRPGEAQPETANSKFLRMLGEPQRWEIWMVAPSAYEEESYSQLTPVEVKPGASMKEVYAEAFDAISDEERALGVAGDEILYIPALVGAATEVALYGTHRPYVVKATPGSRQPARER